ncbi:hypothetical protein TWF481_010956 [Arthrobotrys musiformis]|uniref:3CxxC-type domain-containing protein n=1 Tax=Arthrobotrys musiformis TaxID=47236 RepID=A0AAV9VWZ4_9PEZI
MTLTNAKKFRNKLQRMDRAELNRLDMARYTRDERRWINDERVRRSREPAEANAGIEALTNSMAGLTVDLGLRARVEEGNDDDSDFLASADPPTAASWSPPPAQPPKPWHLFPEYHVLIAESVPRVVFTPNVRGADHEYTTFLVGRFTCSGEGCGKAWTSGKVATKIRGYDRRDGQLEYSVQVFNQRCKTCESLGWMNLEIEAYVERVERRLRIWKGESLPRLPWNEKHTPPHKSELCEGCKAGVCPESSDRVMRLGL